MDFLANPIGLNSTSLPAPDVSPMFSTALMGHVSIYPTEHDRNDDGFMDMPKGSLVTLANRWDYHNNKSGIRRPAQCPVGAGSKRRWTGIHGGDTDHLYRTNIDGDRLQAVAKVGYVFPNKRYNSIGSQWGFTRHVQNAEIGHTLYDASQTSFYGNWLYQSIIGDSRHKYVTGLSFRYEDYKEQLDNQSLRLQGNRAGCLF